MKTQVAIANISDSVVDYQLCGVCSTILDILLFMVEVVVLCWMQFYCILREAAFVATAILVPFVIFFTWFAISFYRNLAVHACEKITNDIKELEELNQVITDKKYEINMKP